jgi:hypothetical protein
MAVAALRRDDAARMVERVVEGLPRAECRTCDCFQGFLTQLEIDCQEDVGDITGG